MNNMWSIRNSLAVQWLGPSLPRAQVQSLVGELRSCKLLGVGEKSIYPNNGILFNPKKEGNSDTTTRVNLEDIMLSGTIMLSHKRLSTV